MPKKTPTDHVITIESKVAGVTCEAVLTLDHPESNGRDPILVREGPPPPQIHIGKVELEKLWVVTSSTSKAALKALEQAGYSFTIKPG